MMSGKIKESEPVAKEGGITLGQRQATMGGGCKTRNKEAPNE